jgi:transcriptional regulator with XRE-family HTH domain
MTAKILEIVAKNIYRHRIILGITQKEAAKRSGISNFYYRKIEKGNVNVQTETLHKIADVLNVNIREFFQDYKKINVRIN